MLLKCYPQCFSKFGKLNISHRTGKDQFSLQSWNAKNVQTKQCSNWSTTVLISQASKFMLKILHARLQQYVNQELPDIQDGFQRGSRTRNCIAKFVCFLLWWWFVWLFFLFVCFCFFALWRKERSSRKTSTSASLTTLKPLTVWVTTNCGKFLKKWEFQTTLAVCRSNGNS